jgi:putative copper export protein
LPFALAGAIVAAVATLAEPFLYTQFPPTGAAAPSLADAFNSQPDAWLFRLIALVVASVLASVALLLPRLIWISLAAGIAALGGVVGLSMTGHAAGEETWRTAAISVDAMHQITIATWIGGLLLLALSWRSINRTTIARFSVVALPLMVIGIAAGVGNSIFALPSLSSLWESDYGRVIIAKLIVLSFVLELALFHRAALRHAADRASDTLRRMRIPLRIEAILAIVVVLGGSVLSLLAPATIAQPALLTRLEMTHYSEPVAGQDRLQTTLYLSPGEPGPNDIGVGMADKTGAPIPADQIQRVMLDFESLTNQTEQLNIEAAPDADGIWRASGMQLSIADWWRITVTVRRAGVQDVVTPFYLLLPDPNLNGFDGATGDSDPDAEAVFQRGLQGMTSLHSASFTQQLSSGSAGTIVFSQTKVNDGADGTTPAMSVSTETTTVITIGDQRWIGQAGGRWGQTGSNPPVPPSEWGQDYAAATDFRLGGVEEINGEQAQIISFYAPETYLAPAYYVWWVGVDSGRVLQVAMVSRVHYMTEQFGDFNAPIEITPPVNESGTPVAEPGLKIDTVGAATPVPAG